MRSQEIILNLWYVIDDLGLIYSLRARCYIGTGTDEEKLAFLQSFAKTDFLIAQPFPIPERLHTIFDDGAKSRKVPMASYSGLRAMNVFGTLFEEVFEEMQNQLPAQTGLSIGQHPITCITPLLGDEDGNMRPLTGNKERI